MRQTNQDVLRGWKCDCGNIIGMMHRNSNRIMVLDVFRVQVTLAELQIMVVAAKSSDYSMRHVIGGDVICVQCGRANRWDATEAFMRRRAKKRMPNL